MNVTTIAIIKASRANNIVHMLTIVQIQKHMRYWLGQTIKCRNVLGRTSYDKKNCFGREGKNSLLELSVVSVKKISLGQLIITLATVTATRIGE